MTSVHFHLTDAEGRIMQSIGIGCFAADSAPY